MKKFAFALLAIAAPAFAIPEPYWIRVNEITAISQNADVKKVIQAGMHYGVGTGFIDTVEHVQGGYVFRTGNCTLGVRVSYERPPHLMGTGTLVLDIDKALQCAGASQ